MTTDRHPEDAEGAEDLSQLLMPYGKSEEEVKALVRGSMEVRCPACGEWLRIVDTSVCHMIGGGVDRLVKIRGEMEFEAESHECESLLTLAVEMAGRAQEVSDEFDGD